MGFLWGKSIWDIGFIDDFQKNKIYTTTPRKLAEFLEIINKQLYDFQPLEKAVFGKLAEFFWASPLKVDNDDNHKKIFEKGTPEIDQVISGSRKCNPQFSKTL